MDTTLNDPDRDSWRSLARKASRKFEADRHDEAAKERLRRQIQSKQHPNHQPEPSPVQNAVGLRIKNRTLQPPTSMQKLTINLPEINVCEELAIIIIT